METENGRSLQTSAVGQKIRVRFATNRNQTGDNKVFGSEFRNAPDGSLFVTGTIDVYHRGGNPHPNWVPDPDSVRLDPTPAAASSSIAQAIASVGSTSDAMTSFIEDRLQAEAVKGKSSENSGIVFLHGFNSTFIDSMSASAQVVSAYGANDVFCFSWPSQGKFDLGSYLTDRSNAYASGKAISLSLSVVFSKLLNIAEANRPNLHIVCHSMGNRALSAALQSISISGPELLSDNYFEYALLMAADEDYDALDEQLKLRSLLPLANNIDIYTNEDDLAMAASLFVNVHTPLGSFGPAHFDKLPGKVIWIDCTIVGSTYENDGSSNYGHQYYRLSETVTADVHQVLLGTAPDKVTPRIPDSQFPMRKFVIPASISSNWARSRGYKV
jgi:esterase/lipase superfamily enzyme